MVAYKHIVTFNATFQSNWTKYSNNRL